MKIKKIGILSLLIMTNLPVSADHYQPIPHCYEPSKPLWLASLNYQQRYDYDVQQYEMCLRKFIEAQKNAVKTHSQAAQSVLEALTEFRKSK